MRLRHYNATDWVGGIVTGQRRFYFIILLNPPSYVNVRSWSGVLGKSSVENMCHYFCSCHSFCTGSGPDHLDVAKIYPEDHDFKVYLVGSLKKFCCIIPNGTTLSELSYNSATVNRRTRVGQTYLFDLEMVPTTTWGYNMHCYLHSRPKSGDAITVFASCK